MIWQSKMGAVKGEIKAVAEGRGKPTKASWFEDWKNCPKLADSDGLFVSAFAELSTDRPQSFGGFPQIRSRDLHWWAKERARLSDGFIDSFMEVMTRADAMFCEWVNSDERKEEKKKEVEKDKKKARVSQRVKEMRSRYKERMSDGG